MIVRQAVLAIEVRLRHRVHERVARARQLEAVRLLEVDLMIGKVDGVLRVARVLDAVGLGAEVGQLRERAEKEVRHVGRQADGRRLIDDRVSLCRPTPGGAMRKGG